VIFSNEIKFICITILISEKFLFHKFDIMFFGKCIEMEPNENN